ncbi:MAG: PrsW family intramembrane metalloprotease [Chloroflexota bacterium]|nr:MAG: PrsW family intramembrane metalloprotease [Chloroflexota bacterium]
MLEQSEHRNRIWSYLSIIVGCLLLLIGTLATVSYLGLPFVLTGDDILGPQLGQMATIFLGLAGGGLAFYHGLNSLRSKPSSPARLPPAYFFVITFAIVLGLGNVLLNYEVAVDLLFPPLFLLGAALPTFGVLAYAGKQLGWPVTWRQGSTALVTGSTLSVVVTLVLGTFISALIFILIMPFELLAGSIEELMQFGGAGFLERFFFSPYVIVTLLITALQAPIPEEFAKAIGPAFMNSRLRNERQAFMIGLTAGAGFAILENMLYEGIYAQWSGWSWGGVTLLRAIGSVLHPLCTAIIAVALFRERERNPGWFGRVAKAYVFSVAIHTLWNGGFDAFLYITGIDYYSGLGRSLNVYGESVTIMLIVYLVVLSLGLWWLLRSTVISMSQDVQPAIQPVAVSARALGVLAFASVLVIVPVGAALGPALDAIREALTLGPP